MNHMRISGTKPSSVILRKTMFRKLNYDTQKVPKQGRAKRDGVINPQNYIFNKF